MAPTHTPPPRTPCTACRSTRAPATTPCAPRWRPHRSGATDASRRRPGYRRRRCVAHATRVRHRCTRTASSASTVGATRCRIDGRAKPARRTSRPASRPAGQQARTPGEPFCGEQQPVARPRPIRRLWRLLVGRLPRRPRRRSPRRTGRHRRPRWRGRRAVPILRDGRRDREQNLRERSMRRLSVTLGDRHGPVRNHRILWARGELNQLPRYLCVPHNPVTRRNTSS